MKSMNEPEIAFTSDDEKRLLDFDQARKRLGISRSTLLRWIKDGSVAGYKAGKQWRFYDDDLDRIIIREDEAPYAAGDDGAAARELAACGIATEDVPALQWHEQFWCDWMDKEQWLWLACGTGAEGAWLAAHPAEPGAPARRWRIMPETMRRISAWWARWAGGARVSPARPGVLSTIRGSAGDEQHTLLLPLHVRTLPHWELWFETAETREHVQTLAGQGIQDWIVCGPARRETAAAAYALAQWLAEALRIARPAVDATESEPTYYWPPALHLYRSSAEADAVVNADVHIFDAPGETALSRRGIRTPRLRILLAYQQTPQRVPEDRSGCVTVFQAQDAWRMKVVNP